jgi:hypothetical protein
MSAQQPVSSSWGQRSISIGSPAGRGQRPADPGELGRGVHPAAGVEERTVHVEGHALGAKHVGDLDT